MRHSVWEVARCCEVSHERWQLGVGHAFPYRTLWLAARLEFATGVKVTA